MEELCIDVLGNGGSYQQLGLGSGKPLIVVGVDVLRGCRGSMFTKLHNEYFRSDEYTLVLEPALSPISREGFLSGQPPLGSANAFGSDAYVTSVPGDAGDDFLHRKLDAIVAAQLTAVARASDAVQHLWSLEDCKKAALQPHSILDAGDQLELAQVVFDTQPSTRLPPREGDKAARIPEMLIPAELRTLPPCREGIVCPLNARGWALVEKQAEQGIWMVFPGKTPADFPHAWFLRGVVVEQVDSATKQLKERLTLDSRPVNAAKALLGLKRSTRSTSVLGTLELLVGAYAISERDLMKAFYHGRMRDGGQQFFMVCGPGNQVAALDAWAMGYDDSPGHLMDAVQSAVVEFNGWRAPAPPTFPEGSFLTRCSVWYADNNFCGHFVSGPDGQKLHLSVGDPRLKSLAPFAIDSERALNSVLREHNLTWTVSESTLLVSQLETLGLHFDRYSVANSESTLQGIKSLQAPPVSQKDASTRKQLNSVLGSLSYASQHLGDLEVRKQLQDLASIAKQPLAAERITASSYRPEHRVALEKMRDLVVSSRLRLALIDTSRPAIFVWDACVEGYSASLWQYLPVSQVESPPQHPVAGAELEHTPSGLAVRANGKLYQLAPVRHISGKWNSVMTTAKAMRLELGALMHGARKFDQILPHFPFVLLRGDHRNLKYMWESTDPAVRRWCLELAQFTNLYLCAEGLQHIRGTVLCADADSRAFGPPQDAEGAEVQSWFDRPALPLSSLLGPPCRPQPAAVVAAITRSGSSAGLAKGKGPEPQAGTPTPAEQLATPSQELPLTVPRLDPSTIFEKFPWLRRVLTAQREGFTDADMQALLRDETLYSHRVEGENILFRSGAVVLPSDSDIIPALLESAHTEVTCHGGALPLSHALSYVYWIGKARDAKAYAASCVQCQLAKAPRSIPRSTYLLHVAMHPFAEMEMDCLVLPRRTEDGFEGLHIVTDDASGWVIVEPVRDQKATTFCTALNNRLFRSYPAPIVMRSDGHPSFKSAEMQALLAQYGTQHRLSAAYNAREHGQVENAVGTAFERLRAIYDGDTPKAADAVERGFRSSASETRMGLSPMRFVFLTAARPQEREFPPLPVESLADWYKAKAELTEAVERCLLARRIDRQYRASVGTSDSPEFAVGDPVMLLRPPQDKLTQGAVAPYVVVSVGDFGVYYGVSLMGPDGQPVGLPIRVAAAQLRRFNMSRTTPEAEWLRLYQQEFGETS